jgi:hypothetical protein|tara:strand:+ start:164 stop:322 length:159 start_codon:yes stop_codon:yes gene_type:complete
MKNYQNKPDEVYEAGKAHKKYDSSYQLPNWYNKSAVSGDYSGGTPQMALSYL